jgi:hypothetical protein
MICRCGVPGAHPDMGEARSPGPATQSTDAQSLYPNQEFAMSSPPTGPIDVVSTAAAKSTLLGI